MKPTSIRLSDLDQERISELKLYYAQVWGITPEEISTTDIISWSIGISHVIKVQYDLSLQNFPNLTKEQYYSQIYEQMNETQFSNNNKN